MSDTELALLRSVVSAADRMAGIATEVLDPDAQRMVVEALQIREEALDDLASSLSRFEENGHSNGGA